MMDGDSETIKIENNGRSYYFGYIFMILVLLNIICIAIYCYKKRSTNDHCKNKYKVVSMESTDNEDL